MIYSKKFLLDQFAPVAVYNKLKKEFNGEIRFLFESASGAEGNYSFIVIGARERLIHKNGKTTYQENENSANEVDKNPFNFLKNYYSKINYDAHLKRSKELGVGFIDGFIGYIGYDAVQIFEPKLKPFMENLVDEINIPDVDLIRPKMTLVYSHKNHNITLISSMKEFYNKFDKLEALLKKPYSYEPMLPLEDKSEGEFAFSKEQFFKMVNKSKSMIESGDVFQVLMTNRYTLKSKIDPFSFYRTLRAKNPSPYLFFMEFEDFTIAGSSPEVMIRLTDGEILLRPIAGTRKRGDTHKHDKELEEEMLSDPKELAEHLMLIDLGRNDVGRVAKTGSVKVEEMMHVERYSHVMHMVSDVIAQLDEKYDMFDLMAATFTAGTMTGAPKIRAMELIAEFEKLKRSFYSGAIGYFGFDGNMDSAITIRTSLIKSDSIILQAGAGIVADSKPELEYLEVKNKLGALISSIEELKKLK